MAIVAAMKAISGFSSIDSYSHTTNVSLAIAKPSVKPARNRNQWQAMAPSLEEANSRLVIKDQWFVCYVSGYMYMFTTAQSQHIQGFT